MSDIKVLQIPRGSMIVLLGVDFPAGPLGEPDMGYLITALIDRCGHDEFVILNVPGSGVVEVFASVDEAVERVRVALDEAGISSTPT